MKKKKDTYSSIGLKTITHSILIGSIPNISGTSAETNIKEKTVEGYGKIANQFPTMGKLIGTRMVLKQTKKLNKLKKGKSL